MKTNKKIFALFLLLQSQFLCHAMRSPRVSLGEVSQITKDCMTIVYDKNKINYDNTNEVIAYANWLFVVYKGYIVNLDINDIHEKDLAIKFNNKIKISAGFINNKITEIANQLNEKIIIRLNKINGTGIFQTQWSSLDTISPLVKESKYNKTSLFNRDKTRFIIIMEEIAEYHRTIGNELFWYLKSLHKIRNIIRKSNKQTGKAESLYEKNDAFHRTCLSIEHLKKAIENFQINVKSNDASFIFNSIIKYIDLISDILTSFKKAFPSKPTKRK